MERKKQRGEKALHMRRAISIIVIIAFLSIGCSKTYGAILITSALPELVMQHDNLENDTLEQPEQAPEFPGGVEELMKHLRVDFEVEAPQPSSDHGMSARVIVQFIIDRDGRVIKPRIKRSVDPILDKEALRIVSNLPQWKPGMQGGKVVMTRFTVPCLFTICYKSK